MRDPWPSDGAVPDGIGVTGGLDGLVVHLPEPERTLGREARVGAAGLASVLLLLAMAMALAVGTDALGLSETWGTVWTTIVLMPGAVAVFAGCFWLVTDHVAARSAMDLELRPLELVRRWGEAVTTWRWEEVHEVRADGHLVLTTGRVVPLFADRDAEQTAWLVTQLRRAHGAATEGSDDDVPDALRGLRERPPSQAQGTHEHV